MEPLFPYDSEGGLPALRPHVYHAAARGPRPRLDGGPLRPPDRRYNLLVGHDGGQAPTPMIIEDQPKKIAKGIVGA